MELKQLIEQLKAVQSDGNPHPCPRCGLNSAGTRTALSRQADVYICDECGTDEAMRAAANLAPLPLEYWNYYAAFKELKPVKSCLNCVHREVCLQRGLAIFMLFIQTGRYEEAEYAKADLDISGECNHYELEKEDEDL